MAPGEGRAAAPPAPRGDLELVIQAQAGDRAAFHELYLRHARAVHAVLLAWVPPAEAEDLAQDVFLTAWQALPRLHSGGRAGAWLAGIARNQARRHRRRTRRAPQSLPAALVAAEPPEGGHGVAILRLVRELPEAYRETLAMRFVEGLTGPEIARASGLTEGSVRVNLHRGMKLLRAKLEQEGWL